MDKINCSLIKDILPLYIDDVVSDESKDFIKNHLAECPECKKEYEELQSSFEVPKNIIEENEDKKNIANIKKGVKKDKWQTTFIAVLLVLIFSIFSFAHLTKRDYIDYPYSNIEISTSKDGIVSLSFFGGYEIENEDGIYYISLYTNEFLYLTENVRNQNITVNPNGQEVKTIYYVSNSGRENEVIYGVNPDGEYGGSVVIQRLVLSYYLSTALIGTTGLFIIRMLARKNAKLKKLVNTLILLPISYIFSHILVMGWSGSTYQITLDFIFIIMLTILNYILLLMISNRRKIK